MGVKVLQCFPWYRRCKERSKGRQRPPVTDEENDPPAEKPRLSSTTSWGSDSEGAAGSQAYYSQKARVSFRHQMDGNVNAIDATY